MKKLIIVLAILGLVIRFVEAAPPSSSFTYVDGAVIQPSEVQQNEANIYRYLQVGVDTYADSTIVSADIKDGTIVNADISGSAAIVDTKLAQITTASKVSGAALTSLANIPSGAGQIPVANLGTGTGSSSNYLQGNGAWATISIITWKATNVTDLSLVNQGDVSYTDLDLTSSSSTNAKGVILSVAIVNSVAGEYAIIRFRKNGDTPAYVSGLTAGDGLGGGATGTQGIVIVACDTGQVIEYDIDTESSSTVSASASVIGYWE